MIKYLQIIRYVERTYGENVKNINDIVTVAEKLYYEANPESKMDVPSSVYEKVEKLNKERWEAKSQWIYTNGVNIKWANKILCDIRKIEDTMLF